MKEIKIDDNENSSANLLDLSSGPNNSAGLSIPTMNSTGDSWKPKKTLKRRYHNNEKFK